jgi:UDP-glucose 4-epimerase
MSKKILVVGGAGYIGSYVNQALHDAGFDTVVMDNLCRGHQAAIHHGSFIHGNIGSKQDLEQAMRLGPYDAVMHFAAHIDVGASVRQPQVYYRNNVCHSLQLFEAMLANKIKKLVFSSSAGIFGLPQTKHIAENHPCHPINPYGAGKLMVESILRDLDTSDSMKSSCLRYFNAAGGDPQGNVKLFPRKETNLIPILLRSLKDPQKPQVKIFGSDYPTKDGTCIRDYIHIADLAKAHINALIQLLDGAPSSQYNLGNGNGYSIREVIASVERVTGRRLHVLEADRRPGDPPVLVADSTLASRQLQWVPKYPDLDDMIQHAWDCMSE